MSCERKPVTFCQACGVMALAVTIVVAVSGLFFAGAVAHYTPAVPETPRQFRDDNPEQIAARAKSYEAAVALHQSQMAADPFGAWRHPGAAAWAGIGASVGLLVSVAGILVWRFGSA